MAKQELLIIADYSEESLLTFEELCEICGIHPELIHDFILHDIVRPRGRLKEEWVFDIEQLQRMKRALRLQHDFEINVAGIALVLDLLEELEELRAHTELLERHFSKL